MHAGRGGSPSKINDIALSIPDYYCHYSNCVYMGGADSFQKSGQALIIHDDGSCILANHKRDFMDGHNVVFRDSSLTSMIVSHSTNDLCYRTGPYLLNVRLVQKSIEGKGFLADYKARRVYELKYKDSRLKSKTLIRELGID